MFIGWRRGISGERHSVRRPEGKENVKSEMRLGSTVRGERAGRLAVTEKELQIRCRQCTESSESADGGA
jgi:hypothetical protein